jgi:hypothetical protein
MRKKCRAFARLSSPRGRKPTSRTRAQQARVRPFFAFEIARPRATRGCERPLAAESCRLAPVRRAASAEVDCGRARVETAGESVGPGGNGPRGDRDARAAEVRCARHAPAAPSARNARVRLWITPEQNPEARAKKIGHPRGTQGKGGSSAFRFFPGGQRGRVTVREPRAGSRRRGGATRHAKPSGVQTRRALSLMEKRE